MLTATTIIGDGVPRCERWTWTCLPCDSTWIGTASDHACRWAAEWRRGVWLHKLRWALPAATDEQRATIVDRPIARTEMVRLFGERWSVEHDAATVAVSSAYPVRRRPYTPIAWPAERAADAVGWIEAHLHIYADKLPLDRCIECGETDILKLRTFGLPGSNARDYRLCERCAERAA